MVSSQVPGARTTVSMGDEVLEDVDFFKYLGSILNRDGTSTQEIKARIAQAIATLAKLRPILQSKNISLPVKINLYQSLVSIFLYGCESWTTTAETERRIEALEMRCLDGRSLASPTCNGGPTTRYGGR
ncbi:Hypp820 [Branchiostoma lanceolatum]|uniref:Hypp820 protein n=1 Tax=Branchiostoma lanceolatum TaxID=7740 RepID=A0A8J9YM35_BRALA|nr:Hypp820 [Branchiostoma lanceolatum]